MDALKIAFETVIVGTLALPWIALVVDLFCPTKGQLIDGLLARVKDQTQSAIAGALLFAMAYLVGSSVARVSEDFFNDEDLGTKVTEDAIRTSVYCQPSDPWLLQTGVVLKDNNGAEIESAKLCYGDRQKSVRQAFAVQEGSLLLAGSDKSDRLRYLHQQIVVLRGAALDGVIVSLLCLFAACAKHRPWGRRVLAVVALGILIWALRALGLHLRDHWGNLPGEPPSMEGVLIVIGVAGLCLVWKRVPDRSYGCGFMFSALLTALALSGWWYTEVLYNQTVIYFFYAYSHGAHALAH